MVDAEDADLESIGMKKVEIKRMRRGVAAATGAGVSKGAAASAPQMVQAVPAEPVPAPMVVPNWQGGAQQPGMVQQQPGMMMQQQPMMQQPMMQQQQQQMGMQQPMMQQQMQAPMPMQMQMGMQQQSTIIMQQGGAPTKYIGCTTHCISAFCAPCGWLACCFPLDTLPPGYETHCGIQSLLCCFCLLYWPVICCPVDIRPTGGGGGAYIVTQ